MEKHKETDAALCCDLEVSSFLGMPNDTFWTEPKGKLSEEKDQMDNHNEETVTVDIRSPQVLAIANKLAGTLGEEPNAQAMMDLLIVGNMVGKFLGLDRKDILKMNAEAIQAVHGDPDF